KPMANNSQPARVKREVVEPEVKDMEDQKVAVEQVKGVETKAEENSGSKVPDAVPMSIDEPTPVKVEQENMTKPSDQSAQMYPKP
ncbi:hypothetical protein MKW98_012377, partial [Papaver atlanticum]